MTGTWRTSLLPLNKLGLIQGSRNEEAGVAFLAKLSYLEEMAAAMAMVIMLAALAILAPSARGLDRAEFPPGFLFGAATSAYQVS